jgi:hypothetical protein
MLQPDIIPRIKEACKAACSRVWPADARSFVAIAPKARPSEILQRGDSTMLRGNDVVRLKLKMSVVFVEMTILATTPGAESDAQSQLPRDTGHLLRLLEF